MSETNQQVTVAQGRFPWVPQFEERYGVDKVQWRALIDAVFPTAKSLDSVVLALSYCKARGLDVFKRPVHIVPMYDKARGGTVDTIWPGIGELRTTAARTGEYAGRDPADYGPDIKATYGDVEITHPEWCSVVTYRIVKGVRCAFHGPRVYWAETYATKSHDSKAPNSMWQKRPRGQLEKCADAASLRTAFPEEIGSEYCADEMEGKVIEGRFEQVQESLAPAATRQPAQNKLAQFAAGEAAETANSTAPEGSSSAPAAFDQSVASARVKAICEALGVARDRKTYNGIVKDAAMFIGELDEHWPEGKDTIVAAMKAAEESFDETATQHVESKRAAAADGSRAGAAARTQSEAAK